MGLNLGLNLGTKPKPSTSKLTPLQQAQLKAKKKVKPAVKAKLPGRRLEGSAAAARKVPISLASTARLTKRLDAIAIARSVSRSIIFRKALRIYLDKEGF